MQEISFNEAIKSEVFDIIGDKPTYSDILSCFEFCLNHHVTNSTKTAFNHAIEVLKNEYKQKISISFLTAFSNAKRSEDKRRRIKTFLKECNLYLKLSPRYKKRSHGLRVNSINDLRSSFYEMVISKTEYTDDLNRLNQFKQYCLNQSVRPETLQSLFN